MADQALVGEKELSVDPGGENLERNSQKPSRLPEQLILKDISCQIPTISFDTDIDVDSKRLVPEVEVSLVFSAFPGLD